MSDMTEKRILFVDDEPCMREIMAMLLIEEGYDVSTAVDGFDALVQLRSDTPNLIISDLNMPRMSGTEFLSVVRHRFPSIPVIAISGAYSTGDNFPTGVMADAFYPKSRCHPDELMHTVAELIQAPIGRATNYRPCMPPAVQVARRMHDADSLSSITLTCPDCLRAFPVSIFAESRQGIQEANCEFCTTPVCFLIELSLQPARERSLNPYPSIGASVLLN